MKKHAFSWIARIDIAKMATVPKPIYRLRQFQSRFQGQFSETEKKFSKFSRKHKRPRRAKFILDKMSPVRGIATPDSKLYFRVIVVKAARWGNKNRHIHQWNRIEDQIKIHTITNTWFDKNPKIFSREKTPPSINGAGKPRYQYVED